VTANSEPGLKDFYCPICGTRLSRCPCTDSLADCFSCLSDHRFFVFNHPTLARASACAARLVLPDLSGLSLEEICSFWLSDARARLHLNDQLAELLRFFVENRHNPARFQATHCPACATPLTPYEQPDIWVKGLRCAQGHTWGERGSQLGGIVGGMQITLHAEPSDQVVAELSRGWLRPDPHLEPQLHGSVRLVLQALGQRFGSGA
jgi:hypothetical protein